MGEKTSGMDRWQDEYNRSMSDQWLKGVKVAEDMRRAAHIAGLKEAMEIVSGYIGTGAGKFQIVGAGAIRRAITARIAELEGE